MKKLNQIGMGLLVFTMLGFGQAQADSIVQITAEVQGLEQVSPDALTPFATYWEAMPGAMFAPLPSPPFDLTMPIYSVADGIYLVDATGGALPCGGTIAAMEIESNAVVNLINQIQGAEVVHTMRAMGMDLPGIPGGGGGSGGGSYTNSYIFYSFNTNLLWLQITNISNGTAYANLHNATDQVYAIWSTTNLAIPFTNWQVETEVFPTTSTTNRLPFTVPTLGRQDLFLRAQDWTGVVANGLPDWWTWYYFHTLDLSWTNLDANGNTLGDDFTNHYDPDTIIFTISAPSVYVNTTNPILFLDVTSGVPGAVAILANDTHLAHAAWLPYTNSIVTATLSTDGVYNVSVGLRGFPTNATASWQTVTLIKNTVAPQLTITNPASSTVSHTPIHFNGFASEGLDILIYDLTNASGIFTNQQGYLTGQSYNSSGQVYATNYFQSDDIDLAVGTNVITLHAMDWAGNETNVSFKVNYVVGTNPPVLNIVWPPTGTAVSGGTITLQAQLDNATTIISASKGGNTYQGVVERSGAAWIQNVPLTAGANSITVTATDLNGHTTVTNLSLVENDFGLVIDPLANDQLNEPSVSVFGAIGLPNLTLLVNGVEAATNIDGTWEADDVPVNPAGTAIIGVQVCSNSVKVASQVLYCAQPVMVEMMSYSGHQGLIESPLRQLL